MNKYLLSIILFLALDPKVLAQSSLLAHLATSNRDSNRADLFWQLGDLYDKRPGDEKPDLDSALYFFLADKTLSDSLSYLSGQIEARCSLGKFYFDRDNVREGRAYFLQVIGLAKTRAAPDQQARWLRDMGRYSTQFKDSTFPERTWCLQRALELYKGLQNRDGQARTLKDMGDMHLNQGHLNLADSELTQALAIFRSIGNPNLHYTYDLLSATARNGGHLNKALYYALEAVRSMEATKDSFGAGAFYQKVADVYRDLGRPAESITWYKKACSTSLQTQGIVDYSNLSTLTREMIRLGQTREALIMMQETIHKYGLSDMGWQLEADRALGACYEALGEYDKAEKYYLEMMKLVKILGQRFEEAIEDYYAIAQFYIHFHQYEKARPYVAEAMALAPGLSPLSDRAALHLLSFKVDSAAGDLNSAIRHYVQYKTLSDSMITIAKSRQIEELQIQYKTEKKEQDLAILRTQSQLQEKALGASAQLRNFTFAGILMLLLLLGLVYNRYRLKQKSNRLLQNQQQEINVKNQHLEQMVEEKEWLLREIHHRVKNNLQIIISLLNTQSAFINNEAALAAIRESRHRMQAMSLIHQKLYQHDNIALIDMSAYIPELMNYLKESFNILRELRFDLQVDPIKLDVTQAIPVALILNETITNTLKHAFPEKKPGGQIRVALRYTDAKKILLSIADNGIGFSHDAQPDPNASFGMNLISILSQQLEGDLTIRNEGGITVNILFRPVLSSLPVM